MNALAVFFALCSLLFLTNAYPLLSMPQFPAFLSEGKVKKNNDGFPVTDDEVLQLENLKRSHDGQNHQEKILSATEMSMKKNDEQIPDLVHQLEAAKSLPDGAAISQKHSVPLEPVELLIDETGANNVVTTTNVPAMAKQFHGAARLAFGQRPEVLPTSSTTSTTSATPTITVASTDNPYFQIRTEDFEITSVNVPSAVLLAKEYAMLHEFLTKIDFQKQQNLNEEGKQATPNENDENTPSTNVGETSETDLVETAKTAAKRSSALPDAAKTTELLQKDQGGQTGAFDMAQYVFLTGDEPGVARTIEKWIDRGLISRENALKLLREIRFDIEYLAESHLGQPMPSTELRQNHVKKSYTMHPRIVLPTSSATEQITIQTEKPRKAFVPLWRDSKQFDSAATWSKLQELNTNDEPVDYDETSGRAKIVEFLYTEYTLEEILYKLAKVMFTQSLAHGSDEAQRELQKLTEFLEREGNLGVIPIDLQKKVLNTLLTALSDTLSEHPELLPAARSNLGFPYNKLEE